MSNIRFRSAAHRDFFLEMMNKSKVNDCYHRAFFYVMGIAAETRAKFKIRMGTSRPSVYSADEIEVISRYYKSGTNKCSSRNHAILMFLIHYGLRAKDISDMQRNQIDWERDTISIVTSKTKETITFPLLPIVGKGYILLPLPAQDI